MQHFGSWKAGSQVVIDVAESRKPESESPQKLKLGKNQKPNKSMTQNSGSIRMKQKHTCWIPNVGTFPIIFPHLTPITLATRLLPWGRNWRILFWYYDLYKRKDINMLTSQIPQQMAGRSLHCDTHTYKFRIFNVLSILHT